MSRKNKKFKIVRNIENIEKCYQDKYGYIKGNIYIPNENEKLEIIKYFKEKEFISYA